MGDHSETVEIEFDPSATNYEALLHVFWKNHSPTTRSSRQYMSAIFFHNEAQLQAAKRSKDEEQQHRAQPITTEIAPAGPFYDAEGYHQKYMLRQQRSLLEMLGLSDDEMVSSHVAARLNGYVSSYGKLDEFEKDWSKLGLTREQTDMIRGKLSRRP